MEVVEAKVDLFGPQHDIKLEPPHENSVKREDHQNNLTASEMDLELISSPSMWSFLLKRSKNLYHQKIGKTLAEYFISKLQFHSHFFFHFRPRLELCQTDQSSFRGSWSSSE